MSRLALWIGLLLLVIRGVAVAAPQTEAAQIDAPRLVVQTGHSATPSALAFSPDGRLLASGGFDQAIKLWEVTSGKELRTLNGHLDEVHTLEFSPDGRLLVSGGEDKTLLLHDPATGRMIARQVLQGVIQALEFAPDGGTLAVADSTGTVTLFDVASIRIVREIKASGSSIPALAFSADGRTLVTAALGDTVRVWEVESGKQLAAYRAQAQGITAIVRLGDDDRYALAGIDGAIRIWSLRQQRQLGQLNGHQGAVNSLAVSADGQVLTSVGVDKTVRRWNAENGEQISSEQAADYMHQDPRYFLFNYFSPDHFAVSPTGGVAAWGGKDGTIELLDNGVRRRLRGEADEVLALQFMDKALTAYLNSATDGLAIWAPETGRMHKRMKYDQLPMRDADSRLRYVMLPGKERKLVGLSWSVASDNVAIWDDDSGAWHPLPVQCVGEAVLSADARLAATTGSCLRHTDLRDKADHSNVQNEDKDMSIALGGDKVFVFEKASPHPNARPGITLWDIASRRALRNLPIANASAQALAFSRDGKRLAASEVNGSLHLWQTRTGRELWQVQTSRTDSRTGLDWMPSLAISPDGELLVAGLHHAGQIELRKVSDGTLIGVLPGHTGSVAALAFSPDGRFLISAGSDMTLRYWRMADHALAATLYSFADGSWAVADSEGRFDASDLDEIRGLHWVMPDDPYTPVPLEAFMKDYYEPRLLARILQGEAFKPVRAVAELNRVQPQVRIVGVAPDTREPGRVQVEVEVAAASHEYLRGSRSVSVATAAHDLMLFRDGQLVGHLDGLVVAPGAASRRQTFAVRLPASKSDGDIAFSAYAFNDDRIKSATAHVTYHNPAAALPAQERHAYVVAFGVNAHDNPAWDLGYAANDARLFRRTLVERLERTGQFREVASLELVSQGDEHRADKALLHAVLDRLAGKPASLLLANLPGAERLQPARPDDLVLLTFSSHGHAEGGDYYLLTQHTGSDPAQGKRIDAALLANSISSEELAQWLRDVDAGDMTLVVDACQSAASVQGEGFKPGPMGSRGLGQLAFDKGMRILAASQADEYALENERLHHGLLSHALLVEGLADFRADRAPKDGKIMLDEWLNYGVERVPALAGDIRAGRFALNGKGLVRTAPQARVRPVQQPALFDFAKRRMPVELAVQRGH